MRYEAIKDFKIKTAKGSIELKQGQILELGTLQAQKLGDYVKPLLLDTPKAVEDFAKLFNYKALNKTSPEVPQIARNNESTERDRELERYIGKPSLNPNGYKCITCRAIGERYCLGQDLKGKWWWGWQCLRCRPYNEPERN